MVSPNVAIPVTVNDPPSSSDTLTPANVAVLVTLRFVVLVVPYTSRT